MKTNADKWKEKVDAVTNDPERIEARKDIKPAFTVPRHRAKKFNAELTIRNERGTLMEMQFESDTIEGLKHQIGQVQFLSINGEVEKRQQQWRIENGIKAPKELGGLLEKARKSVSTEEHREAAKNLQSSFEF